MAKKPEIVHLNRFEKWPFKERFKILATDSDGEIQQNSSVKY